MSLLRITECRPLLHFCDLGYCTVKKKKKTRFSWSCFPCTRRVYFSLLYETLRLNPSFLTGSSCAISSFIICPIVSWCSVHFQTLTFPYHTHTDISFFPYTLGLGVSLSSQFWISIPFRKAGLLLALISESIRTYSLTLCLGLTLLFMVILAF